VYNQLTWIKLPLALLVATAEAVVVAANRSRHIDDGAEYLYLESASLFLLFSQ
jgi:hypothetical protein